MMCNECALTNYDLNFHLRSVTELMGFHMFSLTFHMHTTTGGTLLLSVANRVVSEVTEHQSSSP